MTFSLEKGSLFPGEYYSKSSAVFNSAGHRYLCTMPICNAFGNGEPQSISALGSVPCGVRAVKTLKKVGKMLWRNGGTGIVDRKPDPFLCFLQSNSHGSLWSGVFYRVVQQDDNKAAELCFISPYSQIGGDLF